MNDRKPSKHYFRQRQRNRLFEDVIKAIEAAASERGIRRKDIAATLDVSPSQVSRWLSGPSNWGVDTVSDLLYAIECELDFMPARFSGRAKRNEYHPVGQPFVAAPINTKSTSSAPTNRVVVPATAFVKMKGDSIAARPRNG